jgi:chemotaxis protein CheD
VETVGLTRSGHERVVGVGDLVVSDDPSELLVTYSLGSCIGLTLFDPVARVGGLLHAMLPLSSIDPGRASGNPAMFADTGVSTLLQALFDLGARRKDLIACAAGAANQMDRQDLFRIGERNYIVLRRLLWKNEILLSGEDIGGTASRNLYLDMATGETLLRVFGKAWMLGNGRKG